MRLGFEIRKVKHSKMYLKAFQGRSVSFNFQFGDIEKSKGQGMKYSQIEFMFPREEIKKKSCFFL